MSKGLKLTKAAAVAPPNNDGLAETYHLTTARDHMLFKEMWGGSAKVISQKTYTMIKVPIMKDGKLDGYTWKSLYEEIEISDRLVKCFDEVLVNAADQAAKTNKLKSPHKMTILVISFDIETGNITISNNGDGFDVAIHPNDPHKRYIPEIITTEALRGSNYVKELGNKKAGTNGVGSKLANAHSLSFTLDTYDIYRKVRFQQTSLNHIDMINPPVITPGEHTPITKIEFQLDYAAVGFGYLDPLDPNDKDTKKPKDRFRRCTLTKENLLQIEKVLRMRVAQMAVYLGGMCSVYYNNDEVPFKSLENLAAVVYEGKKLFIGKAKLFSAAIKVVADTDKFNEKKVAEAAEFNKARQHVADWQIIVAIDVQTSEQLSFVNGVVCTEGNHLEKIKEELHSAAKERAKDLVESIQKYHGQLMLGVAIMMSGEIPNVEWGGGQLKTAVKLDKKTFAGLELDKKFIKDVCETLYDRMLIAKGSTKKSASVHIRNDRYQRAEVLGPGSTLMIAEGDSALGMIDIGRRDAKCGIGTKRFGTFFLGGVPMNARKEVEVRQIEGHDPIKIQSKRLVNNQSFQELVAIIGLDFNKKYETDKEIAGLKYSEIWLIVDEDLDGRGAICGLFLNFIEIFWPNLFKHGIIKRLRTPLVRLYPTKHKKTQKVLEYFDEEKAKQFMVEDDNADKYEVRYYKGLAGHEPHEIQNIFKNYKSSLITYVLDDQGKASFDMYYADSTAPRKIEFSSPMRDLTDVEKNALEKNKIMTCSTQLKVYTKEYKLDNLIRKLPSIVDGFVITRRRILFGAIDTFGYNGANTPLKIFQFGGAVAQRANYHHGNESLYDCIIKMGQFYGCGGPFMPLLSRKGVFGSAFHGGKDAGSARYIGCSLNRKLVSKLFPQEDTMILDYLFEDGKRSIPQYYAPVAPTVLFRSEKIPADGWSYIMWARDVLATLNVIRDLIKGNETKAKNVRLPPSAVGFKGKFMYDISGVEYSLGTYIATDKEIIITSLPLRVWGKSYIDSFKKVEEYKDAARPNVVKKRVIDDEYADEYKEYFTGKGPTDECDGDLIKITFKLQPGALEKIKIGKVSTALTKIQKIANTEDKIIKEARDINGEKAADEPEDEEPVEVVPDPPEVIIIGDNVQKFFGIIVKMRHNLNIMTKDLAVKEYKTYEEILFDWFPIRRDIYEKRIYREFTLMQIEIKYLKEQLRFIQTYGPIGMSEKLKADQMIEILTRNKFPRVYKVIYNNPGYADENPTEKLDELIFDSKEADYLYLLHLHSLDRSIENQKKLQEKIDALEKQLIVIAHEWTNDAFHGASQWMRELDAFEAVYNQGIASAWTFGENDNIVFEVK